jgi:4-hydroxy-tetrahydrodipicolinate synthase
MFQGTHTALITPFNRDETVDYGCLRALVEWQIASGVEGIVAVGTTGEAPTLDHAGHVAVIEAIAVAVNKRVKVIAGTGANATREALHLTREILGLGVDATLQVTPYYNKPNNEGLYRHFASVADLGLPVMLYNVPGRSVREIPLAVVARLAKHPNIAAIKEAGNSVDRVSAIRDACGIEIISGDDSLALPMISVGATGLVSVASNVAPRETGDLVRAALAGDLATARNLHARLFPRFRDLFIDTSPIPCKTALHLMGRAPLTMRLPLCETTPEIEAQIKATLAACGIS